MTCQRNRSSGVLCLRLHCIGVLRSSVFPINGGETLWVGTTRQTTLLLVICVPLG